jgi:hypothetical protein
MAESTNPVFEIDIKATESVRNRDSLSVIDDKEIDWHSDSFQFQPQLLLNGREQRGGGGAGPGTCPGGRLRLRR